MSLKKCFVIFWFIFIVCVMCSCDINENAENKTSSNASLTKKSCEEEIWENISWNPKKYSKQDEDYEYVYVKSEDGKYSWVIQVKRKNTSKSDTLRFPQSINGAKLVRLGDFTMYEEDSNTDKEFNKNIFGEYVEVAHGSSGKCKSTEKIKNIIIPDSVQKIEAVALSGFDRMEEIKMPRNLESIGDYVFYKCSKLKRIKFFENVKDLSPRTFGECYNLENVEIDKNNMHFVSENSMIFDRTKQKLLWICSSCKEIEIPDGVDELGEYLLYDSCLEKLSIPSTVEKIHANSLDGPRLTQVSISEQNKHFFIDKDCLIKRKDGALVLAVVKNKRIKLSKSVKIVDQNAMSSGDYWKSGYGQKLKVVEFSESVKELRGEWYSFCKDARKFIFHGIKPPQIKDVPEGTSKLFGWVKYSVPKKAKNVYKEWFKKNGVKKVELV